MPHTPFLVSIAVEELCILDKAKSKSVSIELRKVLLRRGGKLEIVARKLLGPKKNHP
jgi:hypothetical protein